jgi:hypothetical protein
MPVKEQGKSDALCRPAPTPFFALTNDHRKLAPGGGRMSRIDVDNRKDMQWQPNEI